MEIKFIIHTTRIQYLFNIFYISSLNSITFCILLRKNMDKSTPIYVCILGNDGTGKSTMCSLVNQKTPYKCVERSMKNSDQAEIKSLVQQIRTIDKLTYSYSFQDDWYNFDISHFIQVSGKKMKVVWIMLSAPLETLKKRINSRDEITIFEHQKNLSYFNYVYEEMAYFYGMNIVNSDRPKEEVLQSIKRIVDKSEEVVPIRGLTSRDILQKDLLRQIKSSINEEQVNLIYQSNLVPQIQKKQVSTFYLPKLKLYDSNYQLRKSLVAIWIKENGLRTYQEKKLIFQFQVKQNTLQIVVGLKHGYLFEKVVEGESKMLYKLITNNQILKENFNNKVIIILKSTIYSHTKQTTTEINDLGKVRAVGSMIFLEMLKRNQINHSYISVNKEGIILSRFVQTNKLEIVFKKECLGTDKHSFIGIQNQKQICEADNCYKGGIYIRFDWRNPNHILTKFPNTFLNLDPYYYEIEKSLGKQRFFDEFIRSNQNCKAIGDKCITQDLINGYVKTNLIKQMAIEAYCTFQYYAHEVGLQILDGCMMIDNQNKYIWSQINPDCLRVKSRKQREDYDKDIWRVGGTSSKDLILKKWRIFNNIFIQYFQKNRFMDSQIIQQLFCKQLYAKEILKFSLRDQYRNIYQSIYRGDRPRQLIGTIDIINGQPILVQSSIFKEKHSGANIYEALQYISLLPQILIVDIDGASGKQKNNKQLIHQISSHPSINYFGVGGGIRDIGTAIQYLKIFPNIVISSNLQLIEQISEKDRNKIIVELSINQHNQILTHARTINTGINVIQKMKQLSKLGIQIVSITFNNSEGKLQGLPRTQLRKIMYEVPGPIKKVIIAGGISNIDDIQFVWGFHKCVPQLGSAIWKKKVSIGEILTKIVRLDENNLISGIIQNTYGKNLGLVYLNEQALTKTCEQRYLYRYSRQHKRIMKKGEESGNTQKIISINVDCDNDALLITVGSQHPTFCHLGNSSCFYQNTKKGERKTIQQIQDHILESKNGGGSGYSQKIQNNSKLAIMKMLQQTQQMSYSENKKRKIEQSADLFAHFLMYLNSEDIKMEQVTNELNKRSKTKKERKIKEEENVTRIGIAAGKHTKLIFQFMQKSLGVRILPHGKGKQRNYSIHYQITNKQLFDKVFNQNGRKIQNVVFLSMKPKDLTKLMYKNYIQYGINYSNVVANNCDKYFCLAQCKIQGLRLGLIKRKGEIIPIESWSESNKGIIISQYPLNTVEYFNKKGISTDKYSLIKVSGHSEGFLYDKTFDYCDAIIFSGKTIQDNQLQIQAILQPEIRVVLYSLN